MNTLLRIDGNSILILIFIWILILFAPPIILFVIGNRMENKKTGKILQIIGVVYLIIGLGFCGSLMY